MEAVPWASSFKTAGPVCLVALGLNPNSWPTYINPGTLLGDVGQLKGAICAAKKQGQSTFPGPFGLSL